MYTDEIKLRVRYGETDKMGYVYYGNYPLYYEVARTELIRKLDITYKKLEDIGIMLPVRTLNIKYYKPAEYDNEIKIITTIKELPGLKILFYYEIYNENNELLNSGDTSLVFINSTNRKPCKPPKILLEKLKPYF
ncbi:MAG: thioesterase family protein [Bacteroidota bacterium]|nr:thioesterase family protein [Bacteroidota bacterium]